MAREGRTVCVVGSGRGPHQPERPCAGPGGCRRRSRADLERPGGQRVRRLPHQDHPARHPLARRRDVGLPRGRPAGLDVPCRRQHGAGQRDPCRVRRVRGPGCPGRPEELHHRRPAGHRRAAVGRPGGSLAHPARPSLAPAAHGRDVAAGRGTRPPGAAYDEAGGGHPLPGLRGDVHRGGRDLAGGRRRQGPLPRAGRAADRPGLVVLPDRGRAGAVQGRGGVRDAERVPDPGGVRRPRAARAGPRRSRHDHRGGHLPAGDRARGVALRQRAQPARPGGVRSGPASRSPAPSPP